MQDDHITPATSAVKQEPAPPPVLPMGPFLQPEASTSTSRILSSKKRKRESSSTDKAPKLEDCVLHVQPYTAKSNKKAKEKPRPSNSKASSKEPVPTQPAAVKSATASTSSRQSSRPSRTTQRTGSGDADVRVVDGQDLWIDVSAPIFLPQMSLSPFAA